MNRRAELLAPAGSYESLVAAVNAGADAVYLGGARFGARAYADNLREEDLCRAIRFAHLHDRQIYLTVNTLLRDEELEGLYAYLKPYYECGLDAVIVQDFGVFSYVRRYFPDLPVHASTQMTVLGAEGAGFLRELGASRIVTARELSLEEIRRIHASTDIEIESFIHGALCYCYSGQCLFSSMLGGRSGNRGRCAQPCRLPYQVKERGRTLNSREEAYVLSPKDMCTVDLLPDILEAGVYSLKIEGRMKRPEYTAGVVRIYRKYLDRYLERGRAGYRVSPEDKRELQALYNRGGFSEGYYRKQNGRDMISLTRPNHFEERGQKALKEKQAYEALLAELKKTCVDTQRKENIQGIFRVSTKNPSAFVVKCRDTEAEVTGEAGQVPLNRPMEAEEILRSLQKTGDTPFVFDKLDLEMEEDVFLPVRQLNRMRREALEKLEALLSAQGKRKSVPAPGKPSEDGAAPEGAERAAFAPAIHIQLDQAEYLTEVLKYPEISRVYLNSERTDFGKLKEYAEVCHGAGKECMLALPAVFRTPARSFFEERLPGLKSAGLDGVLVKNLEEWEFLKKASWKLPVVLDHNMYTFNRESLDFWRKQGILHDTLPLELNAGELQRRGCRDSEMLIYGYLPLMTTAGCLHKTVKKCGRRTELLTLTDRYQKEFPVMNYCRYCYNVIYNSEPLSLLGSRAEVERIAPASLRLVFTLESRQEIRRITEAYLRVFCRGEKAELTGERFTKGHLKRGVE